MINACFYRKPIKPNLHDNPRLNITNIKRIETIPWLNYLLLKRDWIEKQTDQKGKIKKVND